MTHSVATLRALVGIDQMQPQYAAYWGLTGRGGLALAGMSQLLVEVEPGNLVFPLMDAALKAADVQSAGQIVERDFGLMELHARGPAAIDAAREAVLAQLGDASDGPPLRIVSSQRLVNVTPYHSQLFNKVRRGEWTLPGDSLFIAEVTPAAHVYRIGNELEKTLAVHLVRMAGTGLFGRLVVGGNESDIASAESLVPRLVTDAAAAPTRQGG